jgi:hypothetical protein
LQQTIKNEIYESPTWYVPRRKRTTLHGWMVAKRGDSRIECLRRTSHIFYRHYDCAWKEVHVQARIERPFFKNLVLEMKFQALAQEWKRESRFASTANQMFLLPSYQKIIGLGPDAIPVILRDLQKESNHWYWALAALSGENPVESQDAGNVRAMRQAWVEWGRQRGLL